MARTLILTPPNKEGYIRDTYYGCWHKRKFISYSWPPLSSYQLAAIIPDSVVRDYSVGNHTKEDVLRGISAEDPDIIIINMGFETLDEDLGFIRSLNEGASRKIIAYGHLPTISPKSLTESGLIDVVIRGEPEKIILKVIENIYDKQELMKIQGVCIRGHISRQKAKAPDLDLLPIPQRDLAKVKHYSNPFALHSPFTTMAVTRGCPHRCIFCIVPAVYEKKFRKRSLPKVMEELRLLKNQGFREIFFRDENLCLERQYISDICRMMIDQKLRFSWMCNSRVDNIDKGLLRLMKEAGCHLIKFGVESASLKTLERMKKGISLEDVRKAISLCRKAGIDSLAHFMLGNPGEDEEDLKNTILFAIRLDPDFASFDKAIHYPGTGLGKISPAFSDGILERQHDLAFRRFYLRPRKILQRLARLKSTHQFRMLLISSLQLWKRMLEK